LPSVDYAALNKKELIAQINQTSAIMPLKPLHPKNGPGTHPFTE